MKHPRVDIAFRYSALGDLVLCSAFVKKHALLGAPLYWVTQKEFAPLVGKHFPPHPALHVLALSCRGIGGAWRAARAGYLLGKTLMRDHRPQQINFYDLHDVPRSQAFGLGLWCALISVPVKLSMLKNPKHSWLRQLSIWLGRDLLKNRWIYLEHQDLLTHSSVAFTPELRSTAGPTERTILLAPAASKWKKEWPAAYWSELIDMLSASFGADKIRIVAPRDHALTMVLQTELAPKQPKLEWLTKLSLADLPNIAAAASLCVCGNSAWLHLAEAAGVPVIALEGPIVAGFGFSPWREASISLERRELKCRPCTKHGGGNCRLSGRDFHACMRRILPAEVFRAIEAKVSR